jgi:hypothetical protein
MSHEILPGPKPNIVIHKIIGDLTYEAMTADEALGLNKGVPTYILLDLGDLNVGLPEGFLDGAKKSYFTNDNLVHMSIYVKSAAIRLIANMVAKITRRQGKLSLHESYDAAMQHLIDLSG